MLLFCPQVLVSLENDRFEMWTCTLTPSHIKPASAICFLGWVGPCGLWGKQGHGCPARDFEPLWTLTILNGWEAVSFHPRCLQVPTLFPFQSPGNGRGIPLHSLSGAQWPGASCLIPFPRGLPKRPWALPVPLTLTWLKTNLISMYPASVFYISIVPL